MRSRERTSRRDGLKKGKGVCGSDVVVIVVVLVSGNAARYGDLMVQGVTENDKHTSASDGKALWMIQHSCMHWTKLKRPKH